MIQQDEMTTLSTVLEKLKSKNWDNEFRWVENGFMVNDKIYQPHELKIIKTYRFEGASDPSDSSILYLIETDNGLIGYSIDAYGVYSNHEDEQGYDNFIRRIPVTERDEQLLFEI